MPIRFRLSGLLPALLLPCLLLIWPAALLAHPHGDIEFRLWLHFNGGRLVALEQEWRLDHHISADLSGSLLQGSRNEGPITGEAAARLKEQGFDQLAAQSYYTDLRQGNRAIMLRPPRDFAARFQRGHLYYRFRQDLAAPLEVKPEGAVIRIADETYYIDTKPMQQPVPLNIVGALPQGCRTDWRVDKAAPVQTGRPAPTALFIACR